MNLLENIREHLRKAIVPSICAMLAASAAAMALTVPATYPPRMFQTQQTHYMRFTVNWNDCVLASNTCSLKRGALPYNAFILRAFGEVITAFNSGGLDDVFVTTGSGAWSGSPTGGGAVGGTTGAVLFTNAPGCNIWQPSAASQSYMPLQQVPTGVGSGIVTTTINCLFTAHGQAAANGVQQLPLWNVSAGINATGNGDTPEGADGGFDIYAQYVQTSTAPTAGQEVFVIEYIAPNDGACFTPPLGSTPSGANSAASNAC